MNIIDKHIANLPDDQKGKYGQVEIILSKGIYEQHEHLFNCGRYKGYKIIKWFK